MGKLMDIIHLLARSLKETETEVKNYLAQAPLKYKVFTIPKRTRGHRVIAQPAKKLKIYQREFLNLITFPVHECATAYIKNRSIKNNAEKHRHNSYLLKMDLEDFFNSLTPYIFWKAWDKNFSCLNKNDKHYVEMLLFWNIGNNALALSVGAPTSPTISNFCMHEIDCVIDLMCKQRNIVYTRYADDMTFTTTLKNTLFDIPSEIEKILKDAFDSQVKVNRTKTKFSSKAHNRHITGVTITNDERLSIGRARKRYIKHLIHHFVLNKLDYNDIFHLKGLISYTKHLEPSFIASLNDKYGNSVMNKIMSFHYE